MIDFWERQRQWFEYGIVQNAANIVIALAIFLVGNWLAKRAAGVIRKILLMRGADALLVNFTGGMIRYGLLVLAAFVAAAQAGLDTTSFLTVLGTAGLAVGLALKDNLSNFSSGIMLVLFRPFAQGDYVTVAGTAGSVEAINLFHTILRSPDNQTVIVPNSLIMSDVIVNTTGRDIRRIDLVIGIGYGDDMTKARSVLTRILENDADVLRDPEWTIAVSELADSSVNFIVRPWVSTEEYWPARWRLTESIKREFDANGISIPFPQRELHIHGNYEV